MKRDFHEVISRKYIFSGSFVCFWQTSRWATKSGACRAYRNRNGNWNANWNDFAYSNSDGLMAWLAENILKILEARGEKRKTGIKVFAIPNEVSLYKEAREKIEKTFGMKVEVLSVKEAKVTGKVIKAAPGKPGILIE
jgi:hypothetical protein